MPIGLIPALGSLTSLTNGGAFQASTPTSATSDAVTGAVNIGGLNVPATPAQTQTQTALLIGGVVVLGSVFLFTRQRRSR